MRARLIATIALLAGTAAAQEPEPGTEAPKTGLGPDSVQRRIEEDRGPQGARFEIEALAPYHAWKERVLQEHGISLGLDYTSVYLKATDSVGRDEATSGMVRFYGAWQLVGDDPGSAGSFVWKLEHRHRLTAIPASGLGIGGVGYAGIFEPPFSDQGERATNLYWRQNFDAGRTVVFAGFLDVTDFVDATAAMPSPWLHYMNFAFSTGAATIGLPNDATLGIAAGTQLGDDFYVHASLTDANADPTQPFDGLETFFDDHEYFKHVEIGWKIDGGSVYTDNVHVTLWHTDGSDKLAVSEGWGATLSASKLIEGRWLPWVKLGYADEGGTLLDHALSVGVGYEPNPTGTMNDDLVGLAFNVGAPNSDTFGSGLDTQFAAEAFYRVQITPELAITPDVQLLVDPALNPNDDVIAIFGIRGRLAF